MTSASDVIPPVQIRKQIVAPFAAGEKFFIESPGDKLVVQLIESAEMIERAPGRVFARGASPNEKRPIARLRE